MRTVGTPSTSGGTRFTTSSTTLDHFRREFHKVALVQQHRMPERSLPWCCTPTILLYYYTTISVVWIRQRHILPATWFWELRRWRQHCLLKSDKLSHLNDWDGQGYESKQCGCTSFCFLSHLITWYTFSFATWVRDLYFSYILSLVCELASWPTRVPRHVLCSSSLHVPCLIANDLYFVHILEIFSRISFNIYYIFHQTVCRAHKHKTSSTANESIPIQKERWLSNGTLMPGFPCPLHLMGWIVLASTE